MPARTVDSPLVKELKAQAEVERRARGNIYATRLLERAARELGARNLEVWRLRKRVRELRREMKWKME